MEQIRKFENSQEIFEIYAILSRNKKALKDKLANFVNDNDLIKCDSLINCLQETLKTEKMNKNKWRVVVKVADREKKELIDVNYLFTIADQYAKNTRSHPKLSI